MTYERDDYMRRQEAEHDMIRMRTPAAPSPMRLINGVPAWQMAVNEAEYRAAAAEARIDALRAEIINTPETADFMAGVPLEAAHQRERWGADHDAGKSPFDWFWLIGYLAQKAADAALRGDDEKAMHHTISTAAALANWHAALSGADTRMRPGIDPPRDSDEHRNGEDPKGLSGEAMPARAEGIAQILSTPSPESSS